ncbi:MAG: glycogen/starch synthase [Candidatus Nanoarchaeia archaeon]
MINPDADYLIEVSWEVCNKIGGIHTVVKSKAKKLQEFYNHYIMIGPYVPKQAEIEFEPKAAPVAFKQIFEKLRNEGINCYWGEDVADQIHTVLIDFSGFYAQKNEIKKKLWEDYKIDSLTAGFDFDEPVVWATAAGRVIEEIAKVLERKRIVAHFHEWLAGAALLYLKKRNVQVATVFTTHATVLGRTLTGNGRPFFEVLNQIDVDKEVYNYNVQAKHQLEKAACQNATIFTTVSEITSIEAEHVLGRKPEVILPNGLDLERFPTFEETSQRHGKTKQQIRNFIEYYFFPYYEFDLENTLFYFITGRYEFHNKGIDIFIEALARLNERLKKEAETKTVVTFFWIPMEIKGIKMQILENKTYYSDIETFIESDLPNIKDNLIYTTVRKRMPTLEDIFSKNFLYELKKKILGFGKKGEPPLVTHDLYNEDSDPILNSFKKLGLLNRKEDRVKVIFYPAYLTGTEGLLDLTYFDAVLGCQLGVFPSYYEPWGYTPLETAALGVPAVTTDLAGFGRFLKEKNKNHGIYVLKRYKKTNEEAIDELARFLYSYTKMAREKRIRLKMEAKKLAHIADWKYLVEHYIEAHNLAIETIFSSHQPILQKVH